MLFCARRISLCFAADKDRTNQGAADMEYYIAKQVDLDFAAAIAAVTNKLQEHGFGILTEIDVRATLKKKLDVDFRPYRILGACNPPFAHKALQLEDKIGLLMPCNVVVQDLGDGRVEVAAVDPAVSMRAVDNPELAALAGEVRGKLQAVIEEL